MKHVLILTTILLSLFADKSVTKSYTINQMMYPDKSLVELKAIALQKAKEEAAKEIFGEFMVSETIMENGRVVGDKVVAKSGGNIHVEGEPSYSNGANFGELTVSIEAYANEEDIADMTPQEASLETFIFTDKYLNAADLRVAAEDAFIIEILSSINPLLRKAIPATARSLVHSLDITQMDLDNDTYTVSGSLEYIPFFVRNAQVELKEEKHSDVILLPQDQKQKKKSPQGFYGSWGGFIMYSNGSSADINVEISDSGFSTIDYVSKKCGGELIVQQKRSSRAVFLQKITYGNCEDDLEVVLQKKSNTQLLFILSKEAKELAKGSMYRD